MKKDHLKDRLDRKSKLARLSLNRETVRLLASEHLNLVAGGANPTPITEKTTETEVQSPC